MRDAADLDVQIILDRTRELNARAQEMLAEVHETTVQGIVVLADSEPPFAMGSGLTVNSLRFAVGMFAMQFARLLHQVSVEEAEEAMQLFQKCRENYLRIGEQDGH